MQWWAAKISIYIFDTNQQFHHHIQQLPILRKALLFHWLKDEARLWPRLCWTIDLQLLMCLNKHHSQAIDCIRSGRMVMFQWSHNTPLKYQCIIKSFTSCTEKDLDERKPQLIATIYVDMSSTTSEIRPTSRINKGLDSSYLILLPRIWQLPSHTVSVLVNLHYQ